MAAAKGFDKAIAKLKGMSDRALSPREALEAIGKQARRRHMQYYSRGGMTVRSAGPPGAKWPALEPGTIKQKRKKNRRRKLVGEGTLKGAYVYRTLGKAVRILNEARHAYFLQVSGVGKKKKKFVVVATDLKRQDKQLLDLVKYIARKFLRTGKTR